MDGGLSYLVGPEAVDVARMTGLALRSSLHKRWEPADIAPEAVRATDRVHLDLSRLTWIEKWRVAWARIGAHYWLRCHYSQRSVSASSRGSSPLSY